MKKSLQCFRCGMIIHARKNPKAYTCSICKEKICQECGAIYKKNKKITCRKHIYDRLKKIMRKIK